MRKGYNTCRACRQPVRNVPDRGRYRIERLLCRDCYRRGNREYYTESLHRWGVLGDWQDGNIVKHDGVVG